MLYEKGFDDCTFMHDVFLEIVSLIFVARNNMHRRAVYVHGWLLSTFSLHFFLDGRESAPLLRPNKELVASSFRLQFKKP